MEKTGRERIPGYSVLVLPVQQLVWGLQMAQQKLKAAGKDLAALRAAASSGGTGDNPFCQAEEASLQEKSTRLAGLEQRILDIEDHIYGPLSELVGAGSD